MKKIWKRTAIGLLSWSFFLSMTGTTPLLAEEEMTSDSDLSYSETETNRTYIEDPELDGSPVIDYSQTDLSDLQTESQNMAGEDGSEIEESFDAITVDSSTSRMETKTLTSTEAEIIVQYQCDNPKQVIPVTLLSDGEMTVLSSGYSNNGEQIASFASTGSKSMEVTLTEKGMEFMQAGNTLPIGLKIKNAAGLNKIELQVSELLKLSHSWSSSGSSGGSNGESTGISNKESQVQPLSGSTTDKINQLKQMFPQNKYWNHKGSEGDDYNPESVTSYPCSDHSSSDLTTGEYRCNVFDTGFRCDGFAFICYYKFNGVYFTDSRATQEISGSAGLKVGDIIYTQTAQDSAGGHYAFVQGISGNTVYKLEANYAGNCRIWHSASVQKSDIVSHWTRKPVNLRYDAKGGSGTMENRTFLYGDSFGLDNIGFYKNGYQFDGWELRKADTKEYVYTNGSQCCVFTSEEDAQSLGYSRLRLSNGASITKANCPSNDIEVVAIWNPANPTRTTMYRLYNPNSGEHFYTSNGAEKSHLLNAGWKDEGTGWIAPSVSNTPVFRVYNPNAGDHHYTTNEAEKNSLVRNGWKSEGIGWYSDDARGVVLYREYNPNAKSGTHNYTTNKAEHDHLISLGWKDEGIAWYGRQ